MRSIQNQTTLRTTAVFASKPLWTGLSFPNALMSFALSACWSGQVRIIASIPVVFINIASQNSHADARYVRKV